MYLVVIGDCISNMLLHDPANMKEHKNVSYFQSKKEGKDQESNTIKHHTWPKIPMGKCVSDCNSSGREFDPGPVPYFRGDWSWNNFYGHSPPFRWFIQEGLLSVTSESMCTNYWLSACSSLPRKKCGLVNWPSRNDHSCWLGT